ncbi:hypothetical protein [Klebsiella pneumoniae]
MFTFILAKGFFMPDLTFKIFSLIDNKKIESAASPGSKMKQIISPVHRLTLIKKTRRRVRFAAWLKGAMLLAMLPQSVSAIVLGPGYTKLGYWNPSVITTQNGRDFSGAQGGSGIHFRDYPNFMIIEAYDNTTRGISENCNGWGSSLSWVTTGDGWSGYLIAQGVYLIISGTASGTQQWWWTEYAAQRTTTGSAAWSSKGMPSGDHKTRAAANCAGIPPYDGVGAFTLLAGTTSRASLEYGVYVLPGAAPATYTNYSLLFGLSMGGSLPNPYERLVLPPLEINKATCTVVTPGLIAFGDVAAGQASAGEGIAVPATLGVTCTNYSGSTIQVSYSVKPKSQAGGKYTLPLISTGGGIAGDVRGFLGPSAENDAGCVDKASSVPMDNTLIPVGTVANTITNSWTAPLTWVLCPRVNAKPGPATAIATIEANW